MANDFRDPNPYASPAFSALPGPELRHRVQGRVLAPAIVLSLVAMVGLGLSVFNVGYAFTEHQVDQQAPEFLQRVQKGAEGPLAAVIQGGFAILNLLILGGAVQMMGRHESDHQVGRCARKTAPDLGGGLGDRLRGTLVPRQRGRPAHTRGMPRLPGRRNAFDVRPATVRAASGGKRPRE